ncbi:helix-turn-helix transcriptional regulator [Cellulosimicrobium funkei]|nr:helix-turn-helix transcriptional regulator [Cellulosimicrobium funkei]
MNETPEQTLDAVGPRLKQMRLRRDVTLTQLAAETRISASTLSRLEAGLRRPTLEQLLPLARYYGVTIDSLVDAPRTADPRLDLRPMSCPDGSVIIPLSRRPGGVQAYKFVRPTGNDDVVPDPRTHEGHDWVYVLNGTLRLILGDQDLRLKAGEAAEFDTRTPHWFGATSAGPVEYLCLVGRQGERAHLRVNEKPGPPQGSGLSSIS